MKDQLNYTQQVWEILDVLAAFGSFSAKLLQEC